MTVGIKTWFEQYGYPVVFVSAMVEGMLLVGGYFPGIFIVFIGVILAESPAQAIAIVAVGTTGLFIAHLINYAMGKYGWYRLFIKFGLRSTLEQAQNKLLRRGGKAIFWSYWLPSMAAFTDTAAGVLHMPFRKFVIASLAGVIFWDSLVGIIVYLLKDDALSIVSPGGTMDFIIQLSIVAVWIMILLIIDQRRRRVGQ